MHSSSDRESQRGSEHSPTTPTSPNRLASFFRRTSITSPPNMSGQHAEQQRLTVSRPEIILSLPGENFTSSPTQSIHDIDPHRPDNGRRYSKPEEDVCYPLLSPHKVPNGIDFDVLREYLNEEIYLKEEEQNDDDNIIYRKKSNESRHQGSYSNNYPWKAEDEEEPEKKVMAGHTPLSRADTNRTYNSINNANSHDIRSLNRRSSSQSKPTVQRKYSLWGDRPKFAPPVDSGAPRFTFYHANTGAINARSLREISHNDQDAMELFQLGEFWLDVLAPTDAELRWISRIFHIHPLTTEDILTEESHEKCDIFRTYMFVCFRSFDQDHYSPDYMAPVNFYNVVSRQCIITFHFTVTPHPSNVLRRINQLKDFITVTPDWINYAIIDDITDSYAPIVRNIELEVDSIDELVLILRESEQSDMLRRIGHCRKKVMGMLRLLNSKADVVKGLIKRFEDRVKDGQVGGSLHGASLSGFNINHDVALYLGDIQDHIVTMLQNLNHYETILSRSHSNYLAQISIELTQTSNVTNDVVGRLTIFATILVPMNLVTGLFGMNVKVPGRDEEDLVWFFWILGGMLMFTVFSLMLSKRSDVL